MMTEMKFQIGKNGLTPGTIQSLNNALKTHKKIRISVFKSSGRDRDSIKEMAEEIKDKLEVSSDYKIIGFTIILRRRLTRAKQVKA